MNPGTRRRSGALVAAAALVTACGIPSCGGAPRPAHLRALPATWYGVTLDDVADLAPIRDSLAALPRRPVARVVFDAGTEPSEYRHAVTRLRQVSYLLGEPVDSSDVPALDRHEYVDRFRDYVRAFRDQVDVWEVGNEVNGGWLGQPVDVAAKVEGAYDTVRRFGGRTALTLYYNPRCAEDAAHDMFTWTTRRIAPRLRRGLDYVLVSYYEHDCGGYAPQLTEWVSVFTRLHSLFPRARLGFGEVGTQPDQPVAEKQAYLTRYYRTAVQTPGYLGGYFWWYYAEDMIPHAGNPLWATLAEAIRSPS